jgi:ABC-type Mn2+/Zn2+ transport system ATPase subunit
MGLTTRNSFNLFSRNKVNEKINKALKEVGLLEKINISIKNLSGGQLQRVLIARALAQDSEILLLDEAFSAVDIGAQEDIMQLIDNINLDGKTILIATHDVNNLEEKFDEVLCLNKHCCAYGDPAEVLTPEVIEEMYGSHNSLLNNKAHFHNEGSGND